MPDRGGIMEGNSGRNRFPKARYRKARNIFEGNDEFKEQFANPIDQERLRLILDSYTYSEQGIGYYTDLFWIGDKEYLAVICPCEGNQIIDLYIMDTRALDKTVRNINEVRLIEQEFYDILESMHDDFVIINKEGVIEKVLPNFEEMYGISAKEAMGASVFEMEERKIFNPSIAIRVMKSLKRETVLQLTGAGKYLMCTAIPIFDMSGKLHRIISYTRDVTKYEALKEEYKNLEETLALYTTQLEQLRQEHEQKSKIIGNSPVMKKVLGMVEKIAKFDATVLLTGESGVGKTLFAEAIHTLSQRKDQPFISINCGAIPENLLESELFGYEKGAFTGANQDGKAGLIELAHKGVLFLDEVGDLPLHMQVKLLKVIQDKKVIRVGGVKEKQVDFRLVAASNRDMAKLIEEGKFREDLYYRLNVISIHIPPLRERKEDIFYLITHFVKKYNEIYKVNHAFSNKAMDYLEAYPWPGNTRELENVVERMIITADDFLITEDMLPQVIFSKGPIEKYDIKDKTLKEILEDIERQVIIKCYKEYKTTTQVAKVLGISQPSASLKLNKYKNEEDRSSSINFLIE